MHPYWKYKIILLFTILFYEKDIYIMNEKVEAAYGSSTFHAWIYPTHLHTEVHWLGKCNVYEMICQHAIESHRPPTPHTRPIYHRGRHVPLCMEYNQQMIVWLFAEGDSLICYPISDRIAWSIIRSMSVIFPTFKQGMLPIGQPLLQNNIFLSVCHQLWKRLPTKPITWNYLGRSQLQIHKTNCISFSQSFRILLVLEFGSAILNDGIVVYKESYELVLP